MRSRPATKPCPRRGFALLITITLLAFLVLLLVSLASLTRVETQVASNSQDQAKARQNALMALNLALGELQKYTGPDQRTTARSDMDATLADTTTASGRWLGAYGGGAEADYAMDPSAVSAAVASASDSRGSQAKLLNWLVSGNETTDFDPTDATHVGIKGNIVTPPASFRFLPTGAVAGLSASVDALTDTITVDDSAGTAGPARLLVGPGTVADSVSDYVAAPLREISAETPGLGSAPVPVGRYAWWIGDEGIKARANLPKATATQAAAAFASNQRAAVELMDAINASGSTTATSSDMLDPKGDLSRYAPASALLGQLVSTEQLPLLSSTQGAALGIMARYRYHDLSVFSSTVLSDPYVGGLKKDLSALLSTGSTTPADTDFIFPPQSGGSTHHLGVPTWGQLRSFVQTTASSTGLAPRAPGMSTASGYSGAPVPTNVGVYPVMSYAALGFRYIAPEGDAVGNRVCLAMTPIVVLWNPYTTRINGTHADGTPVRYTFGIRKHNQGVMQLQGRSASSTPSGGGAYVWTAANALKNFTFGQDGTRRYHTFVIESPGGGIGPGESLVFTLQNNGEDYAYNTNILTNGMNDNYFVAIPNSAYTITEALGAGAIYRVGVCGSNRTVNSVAIPQTMFGVDTYGHWGGAGAGSHEAYLGSYNAGATGYPSGSYPWTTALATNGVYQSFSHVASPFSGTAPYGGSGGYAVSSGATGVLQPEDTLITDMTLKPPAFRMVVKASFSNPAASGANLSTGRTRWILQGNIRAFMMASGSGGITGRPDGSSWPFDISSPDDLKVSSGISLDQASLTETMLYEFRPADVPLLGIGQLQHANLGWLSTMSGNSIGNSNGGNSVQSPDDGSGNLIEVVPQRIVYDSEPLSASAPGDKVTARYDQSWLINRSLWDRYFVSTVPHAGTGRTAAPADTNTTDIPEVLANPLLRRYGSPSDTDLRDAAKVASKLMLAGGFNINSTSEQAWRAILGGSNQLAHDPTGSNEGGGAWSGVVFSRFSRPVTNATGDPWKGYRQLTEIQVARLARDIVAHIRRRGPSVSLADFINRRLGPAPANTSVNSMQNNDPRLKGPLQAALDETTTGAEAINRVDSGALSVFAGTSPAYAVVRPSKKNHFDPYVSGSDNPASPTAPYGTSGAGSPQFLTQADILNAIGAQLSGRSDTFTIRTYGETLNPVTQEIQGRAWCEALVQRVPDYIDGSISAETDLASQPASPAKTTNTSFGRHYKILSFRWLSPENI